MSKNTMIELVSELESLNDSYLKTQFIEMAKKGAYHDFRSKADCGKMLFIEHVQIALSKDRTLSQITESDCGILDRLSKEVKNGDYDEICTKESFEDWFDSDSHFSNYWKIDQEVLEELQVQYKLGAESAWEYLTEKIDALEQELKDMVTGCNTQFEGLEKVIENLEEELRKCAAEINEAQDHIKENGLNGEYWAKELIATKFRIYGFLKKYKEVE